MDFGWCIPCGAAVDVEENRHTHTHAGLKVALFTVVPTGDWEWPIWELF